MQRQVILPTDDKKIRQSDQYFHYSLFISSVCEQEFTQIELEQVTDFSEQVEIKYISPEIGDGAFIKVPLACNQIIGFYFGELKIAERQMQFDPFVVKLNENYVITAKNSTHFSAKMNGGLTQKELQKFCEINGNQITGSEINHIAFPNVKFEAVFYKKDNVSYPAIIVRTTSSIEAGAQLIASYGIHFFHGLKILPLLFAKDGTVLKNSPIQLTQHMFNFITHRTPFWLSCLPCYKEIDESQKDHFFKSLSWDSNLHPFVFLRIANQDTVLALYATAAGISQTEFTISYTKNFDAFLIRGFETFNSLNDFLTYCQFLKIRDDFDFFNEVIKEDEACLYLLKIMRGPDAVIIFKRHHLTAPTLSPTFNLFPAKNSEGYCVGVRYKKNEAQKDYQPGIFYLEQNFLNISLNTIFNFLEKKLQLKLELFDFIRSSPHYHRNHEQACHALNAGMPFAITTCLRDEPALFILWIKDEKIKKIYLQGNDIVKSLRKSQRHERAAVLLDHLIQSLIQPLPESLSGRFNTMTGITPIHS